jgi:hypothetical protein
MSIIFSWQQVVSWRKSRYIHKEGDTFGELVFNVPPFGIGFQAFIQGKLPAVRNDKCGLISSVIFHDDLTERMFTDGQQYLVFKRGHLLILSFRDGKLYLFPFFLMDILCAFQETCASLPRIGRIGGRSFLFN